MQIRQVIPAWSAVATESTQWAAPYPVEGDVEKFRQGGLLAASPSTTTNGSDVMWRTIARHRVGSPSGTGPKKALHSKDPRPSY
jgi:hypothetical protein